MSYIAIISFSIHLVVTGWLMYLLVRNRVFRQLPWFTAYIASEFFGACVGLLLWSFQRNLYITVFWLMAMPQIILIVGAVRESFLRTFVGFRSLSWFPWLIRGVIAIVLFYAGWKAIYAPAAKGNLLQSLLVDGEFAFRWTIVAVGLLSIALERIFRLSRDTREAVVLDGSTIASVGMLAWAVIYSLFGFKYYSVTQYVQEMGYLLATVVWIKRMSRPEIPMGYQELSITPEQAAAELRKYRTAVERLLKRSESKVLTP